VQKDELKAMLKYQIGALKSMVESLGGKLAYVKPHGALYNTAANEITEATTIIQAVQSIDPELILLGLAGSVVEKAAQYNEIRFAAEAFADRTYAAEGKLMNRHRPNAVIHDAKTAAAQVLSIVNNQQVISNEGTAVEVKAQSVCIHGDNPQAVEILEEIGRVLEVEGIGKKAFIFK